MENQILASGVLFFVLIMAFYIIKDISKVSSILNFRRILSMICITYLFYHALDSENSRYFYITCFMSLIMLNQLFLEQKKA